MKNAYNFPCKQTHKKKQALILSDAVQYNSYLAHGLLSSWTVACLNADMLPV